MSEIKFLHGKNLNETAPISKGTFYLDLEKNELWYDDPAGENTTSHIRLFDGLFTDIYNQLDELNYKKIEIKSFTNDKSLVELGSTVNEVTLSVQLNKIPKTATIDGSAISVTNVSFSHTLNGLNLTNNKTFTLKVIDEKDNSATKTTSIAFANQIYYGVAAAPAEINNTFITGLANKTLSNNKARTVSYAAGEGEYLWYCVPTRLGECSFTDTATGFTAAFILAATFEVEVERADGNKYKENYYIYRSTYPNLGSLNIKIT